MKIPDPTPEEIAAECERIREEWTEQQERKRAGLDHEDVETRTYQVFFPRR
jgi:hypothetical protein